MNWVAQPLNVTMVYVLSFKVFTHICKGPIKGLSRLLQQHDLSHTGKFIFNSKYSIVYVTHKLALKEIAVCPVLKTYRVNIDMIDGGAWWQMYHSNIFLSTVMQFKQWSFTTVLGWTLNGWKAAVLESANMFPVLCLFLLTRNKVPLSFHPIHTSATHERESVRRNNLVVSLFLLQREHLNIAMGPVQICPGLQGNPAAGSQEHS